MPGNLTSISVKDLPFALQTLQPRVNVENLIRRVMELSSRASLGCVDPSKVVRYGAIMIRRSVVKTGGRDGGATRWEGTCASTSVAVVGVTEWTRFMTNCKRRKYSSALIAQGMRQLLPSISSRQFGTCDNATSPPRYCFVSSLDTNEPPLVSILRRLMWAGHDVK